jgi:hypothetical protein
LRQQPGEQLVLTGWIAAIVAHPCVSATIDLELGALTVLPSRGIDLRQTQGEQGVVQALNPQPVNDPERVLGHTQALSQCAVFAVLFGTKARQVQTHQQSGHAKA